MTLFLNLLLSHLIGDYWLQTDALCKQKQELKIRSKFLYIHSITIGLLACLFSNEYSTFGIWALIIAISHFIIDLTRSYIKRYPLIMFCVDQFLHIIILYVIAYLYTDNLDKTWSQFSFIPIGYETKIPSLLCAVVICCGMSNVFVKLVLERFHIDLPKSKDKELNKAGALIGNLERLMCLAFILLGKYEAIGFILAAKSILRFRDYEHSKTEYVLAGSMISLGIALLCGLGILLIWGHL